MQYIELTNVVIHANHGCLPEEEKIGSDYRIDLLVRADIAPSLEEDKLENTINYVNFNQIIHEEMAIRSNLIEHVAGRIKRRIFSTEDRVEWLRLKVSKINPPMGGNVQRVSVIVEEERPE